MSWKGEVGRAVERFLDYTDAVIEAYSRNHVSIADASRLSSLCYESLHTVKSAWECVLHASGAAEQAARIRAWLDAFFERSLFKRLERLFRTVQDYAEAAASTSAPLARRCVRGLFPLAVVLVMLTLSQTLNGVPYVCVMSGRRCAVCLCAPSSGGSTQPAVSAITTVCSRYLAKHPE